MKFGEAAQVIRFQVSMDQIAAMYGYQIRRGGFIVCPFHGDHDASLKLYSNRNGHAGWHCFGCGRGGSVVDFVMEHDGCTFASAVSKINDAFGLGLLSVENMFDRDIRRAEQKRLDAVRNAFDDYIDNIEERTERCVTLLFRWLQEIEAVPKEDRTASEWTRHIWLLNELDYEEYILSECDRLRKEVITWRNKSRISRLQPS